jgi:hypothetical protein
MPLIDLRKLGKSYTVRVKCTNCHEIQELRIPKGERVDTYLNSEKALCSNCGCATLELRKEMGKEEKDGEKKPFG